MAKWRKIVWYSCFARPVTKIISAATSKLQPSSKTGKTRPREKVQFYEVKKRTDQRKRKCEIVAENCWWSGDILSVRLPRANQYYICTWYIHWIITSNIVTLVHQRQEGREAKGSFGFGPWHICPKNFTLRRAEKRSFATKFRDKDASQCSCFANVQCFLIFFSK